MSRDATDPLAIDVDEAAAAALEDGDSDGSELIGRLIDGRYRLEATLGRGGMGLVFRAAHVGLRRQVAVKILHPSLATSPDVRNRFEREALAVGKIDHPNCVSVYDVGRLPDGSLYLAMELLEGRALADVLEQEGQLAPGRALHILAGVLRGLSHIHAAGLIHRDIKPENIFLIRQGTDEDFAKILDFGIAKPMSKSDLDDGVKLTQAGMAFGTPIYMAPEQALGAALDGRADLYAAAILGYEMLCGQPPFYSEDKLEVMSMHTAKPVPPMRTRLIQGGRAVPSSLERLIVRGLTKKPADRYATADSFLAAVEDALRTPEGGATEVSFDRPDEPTGAHALTFADGRIRVSGISDFDQEDASANIADAINEALAIAPHRASAIALPTPASTLGLAAAPAPPLAAPAGAALGPAPLGLGRAGPAAGAAITAAPGAIGAGALAGRGIGLPYTGPHGEPRFGLTPEQRLAQVPAAIVADSHPSLARALEPESLPPRPAPALARARRWPLYAGILALATAAGVAVAIATIPSTPAEDAEPRPDPATPAGQAYDAIERTDFATARRILTEHADAIERDPQGQLVLGHLASHHNDARTAVLAYLRAMQLDPTLRTHRKMRLKLRSLAQDVRRPVLAAAAMEVWLHTGDPDARAALLGAAIAEDLALRKSVRPVIQRHGLHREANWIASYGYDLQQEPDCEARRAVIPLLRALDDPRAIPALQQAIVRKGTQGRYATRPVNACLVEDARAAITYLDGLRRERGAEQEPAGGAEATPGAPPGAR
jgi:serine/threonine-protein kinase